MGDGVEEEKEGVVCVKVNVGCVEGQGVVRELCGATVEPVCFSGI